MRKVLWFCCLSLYATLAAAQLRGGLLPIDEAYKVSADIEKSGVVTVHFVIAPNYYLYRGQMKFIGGKDTTLGEPTLPDGKRYQDPYLGEVETYHDSIEVKVPYMAAPGATSIHLQVGYQGCHEVDPKLCYPPHTKTFDVALTGVARGSSATLAGGGGAEAAAASNATGASRYSGTPATQALLKAAKAARNAGNFDQAFIDYKKAVTLDPDYANAEFEYLTAAPYQNSISLMYHSMKSPPKDPKEAMRKARLADKAVSKRLAREYAAAAARHPHDAIYPWALGLIYAETDLARQEALCRRAIEIDEHFAQAYECLAHSAELHTNLAQAVAYQRKAMELAPNDEDIAGEYAYLLELSGNASDTEVRSLLQRFPDSYVIAMTLADSANGKKPESARVAALAQLVQSAPGGSKLAASYAAEYLYAIYINGDLAKARSLAVEMGGKKKGNPLWGSRLTYVDALIKAQGEIDSGQAQSALGTLKSIAGLKDQGPDYQWYLMQARALDATGKTADGVAVLQDSFVAGPSDAVEEALYTYGAKLGKNKAQVDAALWTAFQSKAKPAHAFTLKRLDNGKPLSLSDYRGKVVIVDFWYPNCGPCREAFPYLQKIAAKFKDQGLTVLAINSIKDQQAFAEPYLVGKGYDFIGLAGDEKFGQDNYGVQGYPTTFLIGADGRIYMTPTLYDDPHERSTELAVEFLLQHAKS
jgi:thiol-disulfide isomerase/thioredoxin/tetratricopeptide (TPR) repeat protein